MTSVELPGARFLRYSPELDGLRAIAVAAVCWTHWVPQHQFGLPFLSGVRLFFVISGYLITTMLLEGRRGASIGSALRTFYIRRTLRIFPAFYVTLFLAAWFDVSTVRDSFAWHFFYLSNVWLESVHWKSPVSHFWSLAVEEQFYLLWPWLMLFCPARALPWVVAGAMVTGPAVRLADAGHHPAFLSVLPTGSADLLGMGAAVALVRAGMWPGGATILARLPIAAAASVPLWLLSYRAIDAAGPAGTLARALCFTFEAIVFGALVSAAVTQSASRWLRPLAWRPVVGIGRLSYSIYLTHVFGPALVFWALARAGVAWSDLGGWILVPSYLLATLLMSGLLWALVERPFNALKTRWPLPIDSAPASALARPA